ncbi:MAG: insulinase family protein [Clostridia bacterium]|nr:insulinase family protein [Clostridia bacterium]
MKELKEGAFAGGFKAVRIRHSEELGGTLAEFVHEETGTELVWMDNGELNKLFCVAFKTLPEDDTGVFHILEHSVLCGSDKFPVKEPLVELMKSSMNTFLNAITFPDKTVYPVSSRNSRDFLNLTEVYLDAVFRPAILTDPNIFYQEGHHIEQAEDGTLSYKGVVFNEMKGSLSRPDWLVSEKISALLYQGSAYGVNSGGDPAFIPDLTYEKTIETYKKYYHPSNARIYLEGDIPFDETFALIDSYLTGAKRGIKIPDEPFSEKVSRTAEISFALSENESQEDRGIYALAKIVCDWREKVKNLAISVIADVLMGSNDAPLKREILSSGLAQDALIYVGGAVPQPYIYVQCTNVADGREKELRELILSTAAKIAGEGFDRDQMEAVITRIEFYAREQEGNMALRRAFRCLSGWLYGGDPLKYLTVDDDFKELRSLLDGTYFEDLAKEIFSDDGFCEVIARPDAKADSELRRKESQRLAKVRESWTEEDVRANAAMNEALVSWQQTPDSPEALATMPVLPLSEIDPEPVIPPTEELTLDGVKVLYHEIPGHGITHFTVYVDLSDFSMRELTVLSRTALFYGTLPTSRYDMLELQKKLKKTVGRMNFGLATKGRAGDTETTTVYFTASCSAFTRDLKEAAELLREIMLNTDFSAKDKIKEIYLQDDERVKKNNISAGHGLGMTVTMAGYSSEGAAVEAIGGISYVNYGHYMAGNFDEGYGELAAVYEKLRRHFHRGRTIVSLTGEDKEDASVIIDTLEEDPGDTAAKGGARYSCEMPSRQGLLIPAQIGFACQGFNFGKAGYSYDGSMSVAAIIASLDFLWNVIRVQGGAYGSGLIVTPGNDIKTYSYRDPSPSRTLAQNKNLGAFLRDFAASGQSTDRYIISAISECEPLASPRVMGMIADNNWFAGLGIEDARRIRREMLATDADSLLRFADILDRFAEEGAECVVAYKEALDGCEDFTISDL